MQKSPEISEKNIQEVPTPFVKGKRKRHKTACVDQRRQPETCGLCGSRNIVHEGAMECYSPYWFCNGSDHTCKNEYLTAFVVEWDSDYLKNFECAHQEIREKYFKLDKKYRKKSAKSDQYQCYINFTGTVVCLDCGATKTICPSCGSRNCWSKFDKKRCKRENGWSPCGYVK